VLKGDLAKFGENKGAKMKKTFVRFKIALLTVLSLIGAAGLFLTGTKTADHDQVLLSKIDQQTVAEKSMDCVGYPS